MSSQHDRELEAQYRHEGAGVVEEHPGLLESSNIEPLDHMKGSGYPADSRSESRAQKQGQHADESVSGGGSGQPTIQIAAKVERGHDLGYNNKERQLKQKPFSQTDTREFYK